MQKKKVIIFIFFFILILVSGNIKVNALNEEIQIEKTVTTYEKFSSASGGEIELEVSNIILNNKASYKYKLKYNEIETQWHDILKVDFENNKINITLNKNENDILSILKITDTAYISIQEIDNSNNIKNVLDNKEIDISIPLSKTFKVGHWNSGYHQVEPIYEVEKILYKYVRVEEPEIISKYLDLQDVYYEEKPDIYYGYYMDSLIEELDISANIPEEEWNELKNMTTDIQPTEEGLYFIWLKAPRTENNKELIGCVFSNRVSKMSVLEEQIIQFQNAELIATVNYNPAENTTEKVTATIKTNKKVTEVDGWILAENQKTLTKVYSNNIKETINLIDIYGKTTYVLIEIDNIIKEEPEEEQEEEIKEEIEPEEEQDKTTAENNFPKAGKSVTFIIAIVTTVIIMIINYRKNKLYNDIK